MCGVVVVTQDYHLQNLNKILRIFLVVLSAQTVEISFKSTRLQNLLLSKPDRIWIVGSKFSQDLSFIIGAFPDGILRFRIGPHCERKQCISLS